MAFQSLNSPIKFLGGYMEADKVTPKYAEGDILAEGTFIGSFKNKFNEDKPHIMLRLEDQSRVVVNTAGHLHYMFYGDDSQVGKGDYVRITYQGYELLEKGKMAGKHAHRFEVAIDPDRYDIIKPKQSLEDKKAYIEDQNLSNFDPTKE